MSRNRLGVAVASLVLSASTLTPASACAGSLLSGYGGPGEGNQAILGSALLGGPSGGSGSGAEGGSGSAAQGSTSAAAGGASESRSGTTGASGVAAGRRRHSSGSANGASGAASAPSARALVVPKAPVNIDVSKTEVLPSSDLEYILLALAALAVTGVLTRLLTRQPRRTLQGR